MSFVAGGAGDDEVIWCGGSAGGAWGGPVVGVVGGGWAPASAVSADAVVALVDAAAELGGDAGVGWGAVEACAWAGVVCGAAVGAWSFDWCGASGVGADSHSGTPVNDGSRPAFGRSALMLAGSEAGAGGDVKDRQCWRGFRLGTLGDAQGVRLVRVARRVTNSTNAVSMSA